MNPVAFTVFGLEVRWYGILIALGVLAALWVATYLAENREGLSDELIVDLGLCVLPSGVIGARLYYVAFQWDYYSANPGEILAIRNGGLAIHGGILFGILAGYIFSRVRKVGFPKLADIVAPGLALAQGIGRWGNFINQEAHGGPTDLPWGIMIDGVKVHPTFLYESILDVGIFLFLFFYFYPKKKYDGQVFLVYGVLYSIGRFFIEGLRTDSLMIGPFRTAQVISLITIVLFTGMMIYYSRKKQ